MSIFPNMDFLLDEVDRRTYLAICLQKRVLPEPTKWSGVRQDLPPNCGFFTAFLLERCRDEQRKIYTLIMRTLPRAENSRHLQSDAVAHAGNRGSKMNGGSLTVDTSKTVIQIELSDLLKQFEQCASRYEALGKDQGEALRKIRDEAIDRLWNIKEKESSQGSSCKMQTLQKASLIWRRTFDDEKNA